MVNWNFLFLTTILLMLLLSGCEGLSQGVNETFKDYSKTENNTLNNITNNTNNSTPETIIIPHEKYEAEIGINVSIASFNVQIYGQSKSSNEYVMNALGDIIEDYDLIAFQEIRDIKGTAFPKLMNTQLQNYEYVISPRLGRTKSKEQYAFIYNPELFTVYNPTVYPDTNNDYERPPYMALFSVYDFDFVLIQVHTKPTDAPSEIAHLEDVVNYAREFYQDSDIFILGDANADCSYYTQGSSLNSYYWIIPSEADTTTGRTDCAYDRIITVNDYTHLIDDYSVDYYSDDALYGNKELVEATSDHYPVYMRLTI